MRGRSTELGAVHRQSKTCEAKHWKLRFISALRLAIKPKKVGGKEIRDNIDLPSETHA